MTVRLGRNLHHQIARRHTQQINPQTFPANKNLIENRVLPIGELSRCLRARIDVCLYPQRMHQLRPRQLRRLRISQSAAPRPAVGETPEDSPPVDGTAFSAGAALAAGDADFFAGLYPHNDQIAPTFAEYSPSHKNCDASGNVSFGCLIRSSSHAKNGAADIDNAH